MCDCLSRTNDVMSSANVTNFISFPSTIIPFIQKLSWIEIDNNSKTMIKKRKNLLFMLSCTTIFVTIKGSIGEGHGILGQAQGEGQKISFPLLRRATSFSTLNLKSPPHLPPC